MKLKKLPVMIAVVLSCNVASAARIVYDTFGTELVESNNHNSIFYYNLSCCDNNFVFPLFVRDFTESYSSAIIDAGARITTALGHTFTLESSSLDSPPFQNRLFFVEMDTGPGETWNGISVPYHVNGTGTVIPCIDVSWTGIDINNDFIGFNYNNATPYNSTCQLNGVNAGLIIMNSYYFNKHNSNPVPSYNDQVHLVMHEYGHFAPIAHAIVDIDNWIIR